MRKLFVAGAVIGMMFFTTNAQAAGGYNMAGCGLGGMFIKDPSTFAQVIAATVNNLISPQTFAITSGTSECSEDGMVKSELKVLFFASVNFENLKQDMARGQGEYLASLAALLGVSEGQQPEFFAMTQENYASLFTSEQTAPSEMLTVLKQKMLAHPALLQVALNQ